MVDDKKVDDPKLNNDGDDDATKAAAEKVEADKAAAAAKAAPVKTDDRVVPEKYDLRLPRNSVLDEGYIEKVESFSKDNKLTNGEAQAILDRDNALQADIIEGQESKLEEKLEAQQKEWVESAKKDSEIGGDNYQQNTELAKRVIDKFGTPALKKALNDSGLGDHPEMVRLCSRFGKKLKDDDFVLAGSAPEAKKSMADAFYEKKDNK